MSEEQLLKLLRLRSDRNIDSITPTRPWVERSRDERRRHGAGVHEASSKHETSKMRERQDATRHDAARREGKHATSQDARQNARQDVRQNANGNTLTAESLASSAVLEMKLLGSEEWTESHRVAMRLFYEMGIDGYLWALGVRAVKLEGMAWEVVQRDCPRGDRYNAKPCSGRGSCTRGLCVCFGKFSGQACEVEGAFAEQDLAYFGAMSRLISLVTLGLGLGAHLLAWVVAGGFFSTQVLVSGDYWSFLLHLQFISLTAFLDTSLPVQYFEWASYFRIFTLQIDPKDVVEGLGFGWRDVFSLPLTHMCYSHPLPEYHPREVLVGDLSSPGGEGNASAISLDTLIPLGYLEGSVAGYRASSAPLLQPQTTPNSWPKHVRYRRNTFLAHELAEGWGGNVGMDKDRGTLEVSFRLLCGTLITCYGLLVFAFVTRRSLATFFVWLRKANRRRKLLSDWKKYEIKARERKKMSPDDLAAEREKAIGEAADEIAIHSAAACHTMDRQETLRLANALTCNTEALNDKMDKRLSRGSMRLKEESEYQSDDEADAIEPGSFLPSTVLLAGIQRDGPQPSALSSTVAAGAFGCPSSPHVGFYVDDVDGVEEEDGEQEGLLQRRKEQDAHKMREEDKVQASAAKDAEQACVLEEDVAWKGFLGLEEDWWETEKMQISWRRNFEKRVEGLLNLARAPSRVLGATAHCEAYGASGLERRVAFGLEAQVASAQVASGLDECLPISSMALLDPCAQSPVAQAAVATAHYGVPAACVAAAHSGGGVASIGEGIGGGWCDKRAAKRAPVLYDIRPSPWSTPSHVNTVDTVVNNKSYSFVDVSEVNNVDMLVNVKADRHAHAQRCAETRRARRHERQERRPHTTAQDGEWAPSHLTHGPHRQLAYDEQLAHEQPACSVCETNPVSRCPQSSSACLNFSSRCPNSSTSTAASSQHYLEEQRGRGWGGRDNLQEAVTAHKACIDAPRHDDNSRHDTARHLDTPTHHCTPTHHTPTNLGQAHQDRSVQGAKEGAEGRCNDFCDVGSCIDWCNVGGTRRLEANACETAGCTAADKVKACPGAGTRLLEVKAADAGVTRQLEVRAAVQQSRVYASVRVAGHKFGFGRKKEANKDFPEGAQERSQSPPGEDEREEKAPSSTDAFDRAFDADATCGACQEIGHSHSDCPLLDEYLLDSRGWQELVPADLVFPRWELPIMTFIVAGVTSSAAAVVAAAGPAGCDWMYSVVVVVLPCIVFQICVFWKVHVNVFGGDEGSKKVWWRENNLGEAGIETQVLLHSNWPRSKAKAKMDYLDAFTTTGWWEEAVSLTEESRVDDDGNMQVVKGGGWLSETKCALATNIVVAEAMLVPALFLRSREGMEAAGAAHDLQAFLSIAKDKLNAVVEHVAKEELRKMGVTEPAIVKHWSVTATEMLWPGNQDCYRRAIYQGEPPDCVHVSDSVKSLLQSSLKNIKGMAITKYADASGSFVNHYRSIYKRYSGHTHLQVHYMSLQILVQFVTAFAVGALAGPAQVSLSPGFFVYTCVMGNVTPRLVSLAVAPIVCLALARLFLSLHLTINPTRRGWYWWE